MKSPTSDSDWQDVDRLVFDWNATSSEGALNRFTPQTLHDHTLNGAASLRVAHRLSVIERIEFLYRLAQMGFSSAELGNIEHSAGERSLMNATAAEWSQQDLWLDIRTWSSASPDNVHRVLAIQNSLNHKVLADFVVNAPMTSEQFHSEISALVGELAGETICIGLAVRLGPEMSAHLELDWVDKVLALGIDRLIVLDEKHQRSRYRDVMPGFVRLLNDLPSPIQLEWRGNDFNGLGVARSLAASRSGASGVHGSLLGIGQQGHNVALDQLVINDAVSGHSAFRFTELVSTCEWLSSQLPWPIPPNYPLLGKDAFRTGSGVHAAAILKALERNHTDLADRVYSSVPASMFGKRQLIEVGPLSGLSNVRHWLNTRGIAYTPETAERILLEAKRAKRVLSEAEMTKIVERLSLSLNPQED